MSVIPYTGSVPRSPQEKEVKTYITPSGKNIFEAWFHHLKDMNTQLAISRRINRLACGNPGHSRFLGDGVFELKIDVGPGYCVYYGELGKTIVLLLCGGDKSTQAKDIFRAKGYWLEYRRRT